MPHCLVAPSGHQVPLGEKSLFVGSDPGSDIPIRAEFGLAPRHFALHHGAGNYRIVALSPSSPLYINDQPVEFYDLKSGDRIKAGRVELVYQGPPLPEIPAISAMVATPTVSPQPLAPSLPEVPAIADLPLPQATPPISIAATPVAATPVSNSAPAAPGMFQVPMVTVLPMKPQNKAVATNQPQAAPIVIKVQPRPAEPSPVMTENPWSSAPTPIPTEVPPAPPSFNQAAAFAPAAPEIESLSPVDAPAPSQPKSLVRAQTQAPITLALIDQSQPPSASVPPLVAPASMFVPEAPSSAMPPPLPEEPPDQLSSFFTAKTVPLVGGLVDESMPPPVPQPLAVGPGVGIYNPHNLGADSGPILGDSVPIRTGYRPPTSPVSPVPLNDDGPQDTLSRLIGNRGLMTGDMADIHARTQSKINALKEQQSLPKAILGAVIAAALGAAVWSMIIFLPWKLYYIVVGLMGLGIGYLVRISGKGWTPIYGVIGCSAALLAGLSSQTMSLLDRYERGALTSTSSDYLDQYDDDLADEDEAMSAAERDALTRMEELTKKVEADGQLTDIEMNQLMVEASSAEAVARAQAATTIFSKSSPKKPAQQPPLSSVPLFVWLIGLFGPKAFIGYVIAGAAAFKASIRILSNEETSDLHSPLNLAIRGDQDLARRYVA
jgi:hypothetical protein